MQMRTAVSEREKKELMQMLVRFVCGDCGAGTRAAAALCAVCSPMDHIPRPPSMQVAAKHPGAPLGNRNNSESSSPSPQPPAAFELRTDSSKERDTSSGRCSSSSRRGSSEESDDLMPRVTWRADRPCALFSGKKVRPSALNSRHLRAHDPSRSDRRLQPHRHRSRPPYRRSPFAARRPRV